MKAFQYATALSTDSARELVADHGAYLAGGNDLLGLLKEYLVSANILVNIKSLPGLNQIESGLKNWTIGALVTVGQIEGHAEIKKSFPGLHEAASEVASQQIRNVATAGAIANAVANAIGVRVGSLPITPAKVLAALGKVPPVSKS